MSYIVIILFCFGGQIILAQELVEPDERLSVAFSESQLAEMRDYNPLKVKWNNWVVQNSFEILTLEPEKLNNLPPLMYFDYSKSENGKKGMIGSEVQDIDQDNINIHEFFHIRNFDTPSLYRIGNTNKAISFHSQKKLTETFNLIQNEK